jgi:uncharacterized protein (DUF58 family)
MIGPTVVMTGDPFGLFKASRTFNQTSELLVYPPTVPLAVFGIPEGELPGGLQTLRRAQHTTPNAAGLRDYMPGDPMNRIHWPASARQQKLMVKEFELDPSADIWIVLDLQEDVHAACPPSVEGKPLTITGRPGGPVGAHFQYANESQASAELLTYHLTLDPTTEEYCVTAAASLASYLISQGRSVGFVAWGQHRVVIPADRGGRQLIKMLRALAVLRAEGTAALSELLVAESRQFNRQDTLLIITPSIEEEWVGALQGQLQRGLRASAVVVEPGTFCGNGNPLIVVSALSSLNVPTYLVKRDDAIDASLAQTYNGAAVRNMR